MESIAADKNKMSMEGLLKLEEKMARIERGLGKESTDLKSRMATMDSGSVGGLYIVNYYYILLMYIGALYK